MAGGLKGLKPLPEKRGQRGENLHGQYYKANPGHAVELDKPLDDATRARWLELAAEMGVKTNLEPGATRGDFIRAVFQQAR